MSEVKNIEKIEVELIAITPNAEKVIEEAGRTCYLSFDKIGANSADEFIRRLIKLGHESPLEHAYATFRIKNCFGVYDKQHSVDCGCDPHVWGQRYVDCDHRRI